MTTATNHEKYLDAWLAVTGQTATPSGPVELPLLTGSMAPAIPAGALLSIAVQPAAVCRAGDVAVFWEDDKLIAHRILLVLRAGPWYWLLEKGDSNPCGRWRPGSAVRGRIKGFSLPGEAPCGNPSNPVLASCGLRQHLRHCLFSIGRRQSTNAKVQDHE